MNGRLDKWGAGLIIRTGLLSGVERMESGREDVLRILDYHRIGHAPSEDGLTDPSLVSATPEAFADQMAYLSRSYHIVSIEELLDALGRGQHLPPKSVMVTFDDGYLDFMREAWPVLHGLRIPAVLFAVTGYLSDSTKVFWWDELYQALHLTACGEIDVPGLGCWALRNGDQRLEAFGDLKCLVMRMDHHQAMRTVDDILDRLGVTVRMHRMMLDWDEVRAMHAQGLDVCAHTVTHPILSRMSPAEARREIAESHAEIAAQLGHSWPVFAYPVGHPADLRPDLITSLREEGFKVAMTMIEGHNVLGRTHPLRMKRVGMAPHLSMEEFRLVLTGFYNVYGAVSKLGLSYR